MEHTPTVPAYPPPPAESTPDPAPPHGPLDELAARRLRLAEHWKTPDAAPAAGEVTAAPLAGLSSDEAASLARTLSPYVGDGLIAAERWIIDWRGYVPNDADKEQREELHACVGVLLARLLPDVSVGPWGKFGLSMSLLYASMRIGAVKKEAPAPPAVAAPSPSGAGATEKPGPNLTLIPPSSPPPASSSPSSAGTVETVDADPWA